MEFISIPVGIHCLIALAGAAGGWYARGYCRHLWHRLLVVALIVYIESVVSVALVG